MKETPQKQPMQRQAQSLEANGTAQPQVAPPAFQLKASPLQMEEGKREQLITKTKELAKSNGTMGTWVEEQFKADPAYMSTDVAAIVAQLEAGTTVEEGAHALLSKIEVAFILSDKTSSIDLLGDKKSDTYRKKDFHKLSYPGNPTNAKKQSVLPDFPMDKAQEVKDLKKKKSKEKDKTKKEEIQKEIDKIYADHPDVKKALDDEGTANQLSSDLNKIRGERRANSGADGVLTETEFNGYGKDEKLWVLEFLDSKFKDIPGETGHKLYEDAKDEYVKMKTAAKADGVDITLGDSYRSLTAAIAAAKGGNRAAVASWSSHTLGLAIDVNLNTGGKRYGTETSTTPMNDVIKKRESSVHKWIFVKGAAYGWFPFQNEPWHWEYNPAGFRDKVQKDLQAFIDAKKAAGAAPKK